MHLFERSVFCCIMANRLPCSVKSPRFIFHHIISFVFEFLAKSLGKESYICISSQHTGTVTSFILYPILYTIVPVMHICTVPQY